MVRLAAVRKTAPAEFATFDTGALEETVRKQFEEYDQLLHDAVHQMGDAALRIGEALSKIREILEPRREFDNYLKSIGVFSRATAYRFINRYEHLQAKLPAPILERVVAAGLSMYGPKDNPFGRYAKAMKKIALPKGPLTSERADAWIAELQNKAVGTRRAARRSSMPELKEQIVRFVIRRFSRIPETDRLGWLREALHEIGNNLGLDIAISLKPEKRVEQAAEALEKTFATARPAMPTAKGRPAVHA